MGFLNPQVTDFKSRFTRDFPYGVDATTVLDADIMTAFADANTAINPDVFPDQASYTAGYLFLSAHYLVLNIDASSGGLSGGGFDWLQQAKSVGGVSESNAIPPRVLENPLFAALASTKYGVRYLLQVLPVLTGQIFPVQGTTQSV